MAEGQTHFEAVPLSHSHPSWPGPAGGPSNMESKHLLSPQASRIWCVLPCLQVLLLLLLVMGDDLECRSHSMMARLLKPSDIGDVSDCGWDCCVD